MLNRHIHTIDVAQNASAQLFHRLGKALDFADGHGEQLVEPCAESDVIRGNGG